MCKNVIKNKIRQKAGFSLTEMLATVLIMSLVTLAIAGGITTAVRVYRQITLKADAQTLLATSIAALNTDLASADISGLAVQKDADGNPVENDHTYTPSGDSMKFYSVDRGYAVNIHNGEGDQAGQIMVTDSIPLVSARTRTFDLHNQIVFNEYPDTEKASTPQHFTYTITIYSGEDTNNTVAEQKVTVNNIFY